MKRNVGLGKPLPYQLNQVPYLFDRLRRLGRDADSWMWIESRDVTVVQHDVERVQVVGQPANLDVVALADDDRVIAVADERLDGPMRHAHERTRGLDDRQAAGPRGCQRTLRGSMRGNHHCRRPYLLEIVRDGYPFVTQRVENGRIVDEVAEDGERPGLGVLAGQCDGVSCQSTCPGILRG